MHLGFVTTYFDSYYRGPIWHQLNRLRERVNVTTYASNHASYQYFSGRENELKKNEKLAENWDIRRFRIAWKVKGFVYPSDLRDILMESRPDIIHSNEYYQPISWQSLKVAKKLGIPFLFTQRTPCYPNPSRAFIHRVLFNPLGAGVVRKSAHIISLTTFGKQLLIKEFGVNPEKITVIPNSLDLSNYRNADGAAFRRANGIPKDAFVVAHVGRVFRMKRIDLLARIFSELQKSVPKSWLLVVGPHEPGEKARVDSVIRELGIRNVTFTGPMPNERIKDAAAAADVVCLTSEKEPFGYSLLEGMAMGRPVVAFAVGGVPDIVRDGKNGYLTEFGNIKGYSNRLCSLAENPDTAKMMGAAGRKDVETRFNLDVTTKQLVSVYRSL